MTSAKLRPSLMILLLLIVGMLGVLLTSSSWVRVTGGLLVLILPGLSALRLGLATQTRSPFVLGFVALAADIATVTVLALLMSVTHVDISRGSMTWAIAVVVILIEVCAVVVGLNESRTDASRSTLKSSRSYYSSPRFIAGGGAVVVLLGASLGYSIVSQRSLDNRLSATALGVSSSGASGGEAHLVISVYNSAGTHERFRLTVTEASGGSVSDTTIDIGARRSSSVPVNMARNETVDVRLYRAADPQTPVRSLSYVT